MQDPPGLIAAAGIGIVSVIDTRQDFLARQDLDAGPTLDLADPAAAWQIHLNHLNTVLAQQGVVEREDDGFFDRTTIGATMAEFYGGDLVVHGWDVGQRHPARLVDRRGRSRGHARHSRGWGQALYAEGICAAPVDVPQDASATDRLLVRLGRDPSWQPA